jgi:ATP-dependent Clp protease adapter protein ClpS
MTAVDFTIGALAVGLVLYSPFFLWFRLHRPKVSRLIAVELEVSLHMAFVAARKLRYETISLEQLLLALLDNPRAADILRACAIDIEAIRTGVYAIVQQTTLAAPGTGPVEPEASPEFQRVLQRAITRVLALRKSPGKLPGTSNTLAWVPAFLRKATDQLVVDGGDVLVALLDESEGRAVEELRRHDVTRLAVTNAIAHGTTRSDRVVPPARREEGIGETAVILENDNFTPMEFVVDVLQDHFGLDLASATRVMLDIHNDGRAECGRFPADKAAEKVERVRAAAMQAGHPLRCTMKAG